MDSRATAREIFFRIKLTIVVATIGALAGAVVYFLYITADYNFEFDQYFSLLKKIFADPDFASFRLDMLLSAASGALIATLPITYTYTR
jgi:hypothetical protein